MRRSGSAVAGRAPYRRGARSRESLWGGMVELWSPMVTQEIERWTQKTGDFLTGIVGGAMSVRKGGKRLARGQAPLGLVGEGIAADAVTL